MTPAWRSGRDPYTLCATSLAHCRVSVNYLCVYVQWGYYNPTDILWGAYSGCAVVLRSWGWEMGEPEGLGAAEHCWETRGVSRPAPPRASIPRGLSSWRDPFAEHVTQEQEAPDRRSSPRDTCPGVDAGTTSRALFYPWRRCRLQNVPRLALRGELMGHVCSLFGVHFRSRVS